MGVFSRRNQHGDVKLSVIVYLNVFIMKTFVALALLVSIYTVADARDMKFKFHCPSHAPRMYVMPSVAVGNFPSPAGTRTVAGCCPDGMDLRATSTYFWCCKKGTKAHCWGTRCDCGGNPSAEYTRSVTAPTVKVIE